MRKHVLVIRHASCRTAAAGGVACLAAVLAVAAWAGPASGPQKAARAGGPYDVRIARDEYGVPHVYADDLGALFFGYGHAVAQDRLFQLEMTRRTSWGTVSEVLGPEFLDLDRNVRRLGCTRQDIHEQIARLAPEYRTMLKAYADGVNDVIDSIARGDARLPPDFARAGSSPRRWTDADVAQVFVAFMATRYSDGSGQVEVRDAAWLQGLTARFGPDKARVIFDDLILGREDPGLIPTIPRGEDWREKAVSPVKLPRPPKADPPRSMSGIVPSGISEVATRLAAAESAHADRFRRLGVPSGLGSYGWVVGPSRTLNGSAILLGGPQMGFYSPGYFHEVGLHGAGFDVVGSTPIGHLPILFGHNAVAAWTATSGYGDPVDVFVEKLDPTDPARYQFKGEWRRMDAREEVFKVKGGADVKETFYRTVHGPVESVDVKHGFAYARARGFAGLELESMAGWIDKTRAETYKAFVAAARRNALSISWLYADRKGDIGFAYCGRYPVRHPDQDRRLPTPGTGEREWQGFVAAEDLPHTVNPARGFLVNWNNQPAERWFSPGIFTGPVHQSRHIIDFFESKGVITLEDVKASVRLGAYRVTSVGYFRPRLLEAVRLLSAGDADLLGAAEVMAKWDANSVDLDGDGRYDSPGFTVYDTWFRQMLADTFTEGTAGPVFRHLQSEQGSNLLLRVLDGKRALLPLKGDYLGGSTPEQAMVAALRKTVDTLRRTFGPVPEKWLVPVAQGGFEFRNYRGVPQGIQPRPTDAAEKPDEKNRPLEVPQGFERLMTFPQMRRGSENHFVVLSDKGAVGLNVVPPGQSGVAPAPGAPSPHFADQIDLLLNFEYKPMRFSKKDVDAAADSVERLSYELKENRQ